MMETPDLQAGASRQGIVIHIVPPDPAKEGRACGAHSGQTVRSLSQALMKFGSRIRRIPKEEMGKRASPMRTSFN